MYDLEGKVALVTGASNKRGIGCASALRLAREGADIVVNGRYRPPERFTPWEREEGWHGIDSLVAEVRAMGRRGLAVTADVSNSREINDMVEKAVSEFGRIDILVNNAALVAKDLGWANVVDVDEEMWKKGITVNLTGVFLMCKAVAKQMIKQGRGGKIINVASLSGKRSQAARAAYSASKAGVLSLTQTLALELGQYQINVNAVCPSATVTWGTMGTRINDEMKQGLSEDEAITKVYKEVYGKVLGDDLFGPLQRLGKAEDISNVIAFLASDQSSYIHGQAINVCGGRLMVR